MSRNRIAVLAALAGIAVVVVLLAPMASSEPDGLSRVAAQEHLDGLARAHPLDHSPVAGYEVRGVGSDRWSTVLAGAIGVGLILGLTVVAQRAVARRT